MMWNISIQEDPLWITRHSHHHHHHHGSSAKHRHQHHHHTNGTTTTTSKHLELVKTCLVKTTCSLSELFGSPRCEEWSRVIRDSGSCGQVAVADHISRRFAVAADHLSSVVPGEESLRVHIEPLERMTLSSSSLSSKADGRLCRRKKTKTAPPPSFTPYILERSDVTCHNYEQVELWARLVIQQTYDRTSDGSLLSLFDDDDDDDKDNSLSSSSSPSSSNATLVLQAAIRNQVGRILRGWTQAHVVHDDSLMKHVATAVVQHELRQHLTTSERGVAFVANGSILPRKSGATQAPMASPPAIPFAAPADSPMCQTIQVAVPRSLYPFLPPHLTTTAQNTTGNNNSGQEEDDSTTTCNVSITGLLVPRGVTLIAGGGYHGKSTLLRTIAAGVYNKIPGDGREFCVTVSQALNIRAEDGRYVNNCNVSAFISNLPTVPTTKTKTASASAASASAAPAASAAAASAPASASSASAASAASASAAPGSKTAAAAAAAAPVLDTAHFSTKEASGSTSQAANVMEALEMRANCFLVDEDVSAANFMARDGRMRALIMDESITPLLYRVNGLFRAHNVSSVVVVGGVGDWLDVPHQVILMQKYACYDATEKARSISKQFSHGHVQYGGRGVVHRLEWDSHKYTPIPRRPTAESARALDKETTVVGLLDGGTGLVFHKTHHAAHDSMGDDYDNNDDDDDDDEDDHRYIDMSRCEQLLGKKPQLFGCGLAALWVLEASRQHPDLGLSDLLDLLDRTMDENGVLSVLAPPNQIIYYHELVETLGHVYRPRRLEVGQAICRLRGVRFEELPQQEDEARARAIAEEERKKRQLMDLWNARRSNSK